MESMRMPMFVPNTKMVIYSAKRFLYGFQKQCRLFFIRSFNEVLKSRWLLIRTLHDVVQVNNKIVLP